MEFVAILIVAALVFGICFLVDKGFSKVFRSQKQHYAGTAVRLNKRYGSIGVVVLVLGIAAVLMGLLDGMLMIVCGSILAIVGIGLVVYYLTCAVFYDEDAFIYTRFGKKSITYHYSDIKAQQLYNSYGNIVIELHMVNGQVVQLQSGMVGVYPFLDKAFICWLKQTGRRQEDCAFYDPANSCWFPPAED